MRPHTIAAAALLALTLGTRAQAQSSSQAAHDATAQAQAVTRTISARNSSGMNGSVRLYPIGHTRTRIVIILPKAGPNERLSLYRGADCSDSVTRARALALAPLNNAAANAPQSSTIVNLPLNELASSDYVVDVRNSTSRATYAEACSHLNGGH
jgi:hypothetical protein